MSLTCGFYNSSNGDRKYNTTQISQIFDGIISDGVYQSIGDAMMVKAGSGMRVNIGVGRAWFNHTWSYNDALYPISIKAAEVVLDRISTVVLKIDTSRTIRNNTFEVIDGTPASAPKPPELKDTAEVFYKPLADIYVKAGTAAITQENITNRVGSDACPFVTGILQSISAEKLMVQWESEFERLFADMKNQIEQIISGQLTDGSVTSKKLADNAVIETKIADKAVSDIKTFSVGSSNWQKVGDVYKLTVVVSGLKSNSKVIVDVDCSSISDADLELVNDEWNKLLKVSVEENGLVFVATDAFERGVPVKLLEVKK